MKYWQSVDWTKGSYSLLRCMLGAYFLFIHLSLLPWSKELFSCEGLFQESFLSPFWGYFPSLFFFFESPTAIIGLQLLALLASVLLMWGKYSRLSAFYLWFFLASAHAKNPFISNPSLAYLGWILLAHSFSPSHPLPRFLREGLWWMIVSGYTINGLYHLESPSWINGSAILSILKNPLSFDNFFIRCLINYPLALKILTWSILAIECLALPLALIPHLRSYLWRILTCMQLGILILVDCPTLTLGMLLAHAFAAKLSWIHPAVSKNAPILLVDGNCLACDSFSKWLLQEDRLHQWKIGYLGGKTHLSLDPTQNQESIIVWDDQLYRGWPAVAHLLCTLGGWWYLLGYMMQITPLPLSRFLYKAIARYRHRLPIKNQCFLLPPSWQKRLLP